MPTADREGLRVEMARALCVAHGTNPDCQHEGSAPDGAVDGYWRRPSTAIRPLGKVPWHFGWRKHIATADALIAGPLAETLAQADTAAQAVAERDEARKDRDDLKQAAGLKPGPLGDGIGRTVVLDDVVGMRPEMVKARRELGRYRGDADLWTMRMLEEWPGDTLLLRLWRQRREATKAANAALAEVARLSAEVEARDKALKVATDALTWLRAPFRNAPRDGATRLMMREAAQEALDEIAALAAGQDKEGGKP